MRSEPDPIADAITALTDAARGTRTMSAGSPNERSEQVDFGEIACRVLTAVAANVGGVERLLSGRPGSWEAGYVREIVRSTAGDSGEELVRWRTEPLRLSLDVVQQLDDLGLLERYDAAASDATSREEEALDSLAMAFSTAEERAIIEATPSEHWDLLDDLDDTDLVGERAAELKSEVLAIAKAVVERARVAGGPLVAALAEAESTCEAIDEKWEQDKATYLTAYADAFREALIERGVTVAVEVIDGGPANTAEEGEPLLDEIHERALIAADMRISQDSPGLGRDEGAHRDGRSCAERVRTVGHSE